jgi:peptidoglycan/LPS O-acetylase OafA/YrhL
VTLPAPSPPTPPWPERYEALDGWRALAATGVVVHHLGYAGDFDLGQYSVMVFFVISGYCVTASAEAGRARGMGFRAFMWRRLRRIYPPYLFAIVFMVGVRAVLTLQGRAGMFPSSPWLWVQNVTMTQWLTLLRHPQSQASSNPSLLVTAFWSLNYEEQFYLVIAALIALTSARRWPLSTGIAALMLVAALWNIALPSRSYGLFVEYWFHFAVGAVVFYRLCRVRDERARRAIDASIALGTALSALVAWGPWQDRVLGERFIYEEWSVVGAFALLLIASRRGNDRLRRSAPGRWLSALGAISYSLYLTHQFNLRPVRALARMIVPAACPHGVRGVLEVALLFVVARGFWHLCERPFLNRALPR